MLRKLLSCVLCVLFAMPVISWSADDDDGAAPRRIEEVVVYGRRVESTVSDTSISITAMDADFLSDMGIQSPDEMVNFIPATTRTDWDIKIRGVGRNFRGLGGDPGVGVYYNGIYSPDFGIAATEGGLYDVERIEVLRGPQGTLYGRNSIGGVINYVTKRPNHEEFEAQLRGIVGTYNTREMYGFVSGPLTEDFAYRVNATKRIRDGAVDGHAGTEDTENINDQNLVLSFDWDINDRMSLYVRGNDRRSLRAGNFGNGGHGVTSEGPCVGQHPINNASQCDPRFRVNRNTSYYAPGFRPVDQAWVDTYGLTTDDPRGAVPWIHPVTGVTTYGAHNRPGVDSTNEWPYMPSPNYNSAAVASYSIGNAEKPDIIALTNNSADEEFDHQAGSLVFDWEISDNLSIRYLGNYQSFEYWFNRDNDFSNSRVSDLDDTVIAQTESWSHELRIFWQLGERWTATSGIYNFEEHRDQWYAIRERGAQGRTINPTVYGTAAHPNWLLDALAVVGWVPGDEIAQTGQPQCLNWQSQPVGGANSATPGYGIYCGDGGEIYNHDDDIGAMYEHRNLIETENLAFYTQGDLQLTDTLSVTLGVRYSKDWRDGLEQRGGYSEINANDYAWLPWAIQTAMNYGEGVNWWDFYAPGVTPLAAMNVAMGAATFNHMEDGSVNPDFPITPTCDLEAVNCATPLRLEGIPISWGHRTPGHFKQDGEWSYRVNFNWEPTPEILVYFGATTSYRAGGWNMGGPDNRVAFDIDGVGECIDGDGAGCDRRALLEYGGEELTAYEIGYKGTHLDGRLQVNLSLYLYDYENYQDHVEVWEESTSNFSLPALALPDGSELSAGGGRGPVSITTNIPSAENRGFEFDILYLLTDNLTIGANASYTKSEYNEEYTFFNEDDPRYPRQVFTGDLQENPCNASPELKALYCLEVDGYQLQGIPEEKMTAWANYTWNFDMGSLTWYNAVAYTGEYSTHPFNRPWDWVPDRYRWDTRLTYREASEKWQASLFVDNVLDDTYIRTADMDARRTGYGTNWPQRVVALYPRYIGFEMVWNF